MHLEVHFFHKKQKTYRQIKNSGGSFLLNAPRGALVFQAEKLKAFLSGNLKGGATQENAQAN